jgi:cobalt-zinc-cadmium efflux system protein
MVHGHPQHAPVEGGATHELHAHKAGDTPHSHAKEVTSQKVLSIALAITIGFAVVEVFAGIYSNSLALISDAGHMVTDAAGLFLAVVAQYLSKRPPSAKYSFGFGRGEALAAFINSMGMIALIVWITIEALDRFNNPHEVGGQTVTIVAFLGLMINVFVAWMLSRDNKSMNTRAALVHVMGDLLGSVAAIIAGVVIQYTGWMQIDPLLSLVVCLLLIRSTISILKESFHFLMKGVPHHIDYLKVGEDLANIAGVNAVHDLHVWEMTPGFPALIGHIEISSLEQWPITMDLIRAMLIKKHGIDHVTLQPELSTP